FQLLYTKQSNGKHERLLQRYMRWERKAHAAPSLRERKPAVNARRFVLLNLVDCATHARDRAESEATAADEGNPGRSLRHSGYHPGAGVVCAEGNFLRHA